MALMSQNNKTYVTLDYDSLNEKGLKNLTKELKSSGVNIEKIIPAETPRKIDGIYTRTVKLIDEDGQTLALQVNDTGDISKFTLNNKVIPISNAKSIKDLSSKLAAAFVRSAPAFKRSLAKKLKKSTDLVSKGKKPAVQSLGSQLKALKAEIETIDSNINQAKESVNQQSTRLSEFNQSLDEKNNVLQQEIAKESTLRDKLKMLEQEKQNVQ